MHSEEERGTYSAMREVRANAWGGGDIGRSELSLKTEIQCSRRRKRRS